MIVMTLIDLGKQYSKGSGHQLSCSFLMVKTCKGYVKPLKTEVLQRAGLCAGVALVFRPPEPLLIENIKLKLRTKVESCLFMPNHSPDLQLADVCLSSHT